MHGLMQSCRGDWLEEHISERFLLIDQIICIKYNAAHSRSLELKSIIWWILAMCEPWAGSSISAIPHRWISYIKHINMQIRSTYPELLVVQAGGVIHTYTWSYQRTQRIHLQSGRVEINCDLHGPKNECQIRLCCGSTGARSYCIECRRI
jgi:hypothetical protein